MLFVCETEVVEIFGTAAPAATAPDFVPLAGEDDQKLGEKSELLSLVCFRERKL